MKQLIFDGKNYYLFRALNDGNKKDFKKNIKSIRTDANRYFKTNGQWGKYCNKSMVSLEEVYDHIKIRYRRDTNCISLSQDANVVLTYHTQDPKYVLIQIPKNELVKIFNAGEYFLDSIEKEVRSGIKKLNGEEEILSIISQIDNSTNISQIREILKKYISSISIFSINERQYLTSIEQIRVAKTIAKLKVLEQNGIIKNIIEGVANDQLLKTMGVAYSSSEYIHYGDIHSKYITSCPKIFIDSIALFQQSQENGVFEEDANRLINKVLDLVKEGYKINKSEGTFENKERSIIIDEQDLKLLTKSSSNKKKLSEKISVRKAYELTGGEISYNDVIMQIKTAEALAEMELKKNAIIRILKKFFPEERNIATILQDTYCINPELVIRQNGKGHKLSDTVNLLISENGYELTRDCTKSFLKNFSRLGNKKILEIYSKSISLAEMKELLIKPRIKRQRISMFNNKSISSVGYMTEAIIERYNWKEVGGLTKKEKDRLALKIATKGVTEEQLHNLFESLKKIDIDNKKFNENEILAVIMNIAINKKLGTVPYSHLLRMNIQTLTNTLAQNINELNPVMNPISIDLLTKRGKTIKNLQQEFINYGLSQKFIEEKDVRNLYTVKQIVDNYPFERELNKEEKKAIIYNLLNRVCLNKDNFYLSRCIEVYEKTGYSKDQIYGMLINLSISSSENSKNRFNYSLALTTPSNFLQNIKENGNLIPNFKISDIAILIAQSKSLYKDDIDKLKEELINLGISEDLIKKVDVRNLFIAKQIVDRYTYKRELDNKEKSALICSIIDNPYFNILKHGNNNLSKTIAIMNKERFEGSRNI